MNQGKALIHRLKTGVPGLDDILGGGLPEWSFNLIGGAPGSGKTTLAHQIMFALASPERPALYFTVLGEPPIKMLRYQQQFGFFDSERINECLRFINLADDAATGDLERVLQRMVSEVEAHGPSLVFVDSFRSLSLAHQENANSYAGLQYFVQQLGVLLTSWQATTFLIGEYASEDDVNPIFTVADGLLWLRQSVERNSVVRKMEISKMRGQRTLPGLHTFRIDDSGIQVFPPQISPRNETRGPAEDAELDRVGVGVPALDVMLGGGLPRGYSILVAGPSGSGKSILAAAFLSEGARLGEGGVIASFERRPMGAHSRGLAELVARGSLVEVDVRQHGLSVDEIAMLLIDQVRESKASRVVIDSLSGFELALAPTFRHDFRESLSRMIAALACTGATVMMTSELEDRFTDLRFSPHGTAFLTDAIIVQRYVEVESRLRRVMAIVKVRGSAHSNELHSYEIDDDGIQVGRMLEDHDGLLGGTPRRREGRGSPPASQADV